MNPESEPYINHLVERAVKLGHSIIKVQIFLRDLKPLDQEKMFDFDKDITTAAIARFGLDNLPRLETSVQQFSVFDEEKRKEKIEAIMKEEGK